MTNAPPVEGRSRGGRSSSAAFEGEHGSLFAECEGCFPSLVGLPSGLVPRHLRGPFARGPGMRNDAGMRCDVAREALSARLDGERPQVLAQQIDAHLESCRSCRAWLIGAAVQNRRFASM